MEKLERLRQNVAKLIKQNQGLKKDNVQLMEKIKRIEEDLNFHVGRNQELPEVVQKNKKLLGERKKIADKIDSILKRMEEIKV